MQTSKNSLRKSNAPEPLAIIGLGCRFPGASNSPEAYWQLLDSATDAISETPEQRWNLQKFYAPDQTLPGKTQSKWGGYVDSIESFDPQLFGISPREAASMDPQQRMLLEVAYRAMEDAGQPAEKLAGQSVSVFVGISSFDYAVAGLSYQDRGVIDAYSNTGGSSSIAANRISYCFDLRGPSVAVDTACSSSLVALHMAAESIWRGDAKLALAGGVNALLMPDFYVAFSQLGVLSPDGRCKTFDARANGYVRSEGAGMILLKPLSAATRDKDDIYAVVRATALNQDGRTPGMTVPSQEAQETLLRTACAKANIDPTQVQYVEAHGTGPPVGDPIEARALGSVLGEGRDSRQPCRIGSVKTNIGHLEAGAGIASVIKVALALHHRRIPAHLHFENANPDIDFDALNLQVPRESQQWDSEVSRIAGVNGFGYGGANAHVILEQAPTSTQVAAHSMTSPPSEEEEKPLAAPILLPLSARSKPALVELSSQYADWLEENKQFQLPELAGYAAHRRSHQSQRATVCASSRKELIEELRALAASTPEEFAEGFSSARLAKGPVFVCSGQGPQWWAMGRGLLRYSPAFRSVIKKCDAEFSKYGDWSLLEELTRSEEDSQMQRTSIAQPSIFAIQVALAAVWDSWGVKPAAIVGHSVGEIAAAYLSGALSWEDACCVAFHRGRTMDLASSQGAMLAAGISPDEVPQWIAGSENEIGIAAINGPTSVTISGEKTAIEQLAAKLDEAGIFCRRLAVEYAFHSPQMEPVQRELKRALAHIKPEKTHTPLISTVTGKLSDGVEVDADYWWRNVRQAVRFSEAMEYLAAEDYGLVVEIGPHPVLAYAINECFQAAKKSVRSVPSLSRQQDDLLAMTKSLGSLYSLGFEIDWSGFYNRPTRKVPLPIYPFQSQELWSESLESKNTRLASSVHPLLGENSDRPEQVWQSRLDLKLQSYLADHRVREACVYPAAAMLESAIAASRQIHDRDQVRLERVQLHSPCILAPDNPQWIETSYDTARMQLQLAVRSCEESEWQPLATLRPSADRPASARSIEEQFSKEFEEIHSRCTDTFDRNRLYEYCGDLGLNYGSRFQGIESGIRRDTESLCQIRLAADELLGDDKDYFLHPAILDSCFHSMIAADYNFDDVLDGLYLPVEIGEFNFYRRAGDRVTVHTQMHSKSKKYMICDLDIYDEQGELCATIRDFKSMRVAGGASVESTEDLIYRYSWTEQNLESEETLEPGMPSRWMIFMDDAGCGRELAARLTQRGGEVIEVYRNGTSVAQTQADFYQIDPEELDSFKATFRDLAGQEKSPNHIVYLWGLDAPSVDQLDVVDLDNSTALTSLAPMHLVQAWDELAAGNVANLSIITSGAQSQNGAPEDTAISQGPLVGFGRVIVSEYGPFRSKLIDLPATLAPEDLDNLARELLSDDEEDEILWREGGRYVNRFGPQTGSQVSALAAEQLPCQLRVGQSSGVEELHYETKAQLPLAPGQVEIEVMASGLNFSDVMKALDLYPGLPDGPVELGAECSGRISRAAKGSSWQVGDEVMAVAPGSFATHVVVNESLVARKPQNLTHEQAASIPIAFLTADYAMNQCARLQSGDSILIHSASGGVGLAAMQLAQQQEIEVLATAGTHEKRMFVSEKGAKHVMDSRSLAFADETMQATQGEGVDAVLNSLPGEAIPKGLSTLKTGGRFLEIGKRDIYSDGALGLYPFRNNLALFAIDLDQLFKQQPKRMGEMLGRLVPRFESGELEPLPITSFAADDTVGAFRFMQQGKHIGKVVVNYSKRPTSIQVGEYAPLELDSHATYWIAGGLGGFGLQIARWMVEKGAKHLVLSGRSKTPRPEAATVIAELRQAGVHIELLPADITKPEDVADVLKTIDAEMPVLKGVIHTAMVLEDRLLVDLDRETLERVLRPKVLGGWNLHQATRDLDLDLFVVFSSLSSVFGHAGQANYSAANAFLDSLAYHRRASGLPATVMNWGHLGEVGYLAEREQLGQRLERQGVLSFTVDQATACLEYALQTESLQLSVLRMDWSLWRGLGITSRVSPRFAHLLQNVSEAGIDASENLSASQLRSAAAQDRLVLVGNMVRSKIGSLLGISAENIDSERALLEMGLDSLMAVEMRNWIEGQMEINLPISTLMRSESLTQVIEAISETIEDGTMLTSEVETDSETVSSTDAEAMLEQLPDMAPEQVEELLAQMLRDES